MVSTPVREGADEAGASFQCENADECPLPSHLKSVPKWLRYMFCGDSVPMMVIHKAREKGLFMDGVNYQVPASLLVYEK